MELFFSLILLLFISFVLLVINVLFSAILRLFGFSFKKSFRKSLWLFVLPPLLLLYGTFIERNATQMRSVEIASCNIPKSFDGYKIVQISDLHLASFEGRKKILQRVVNEINAINADAVLFTGDLVTIKSDELVGKEEILAQLRAKDGVFSIMGNHDYALYERNFTEEERLKDVKSLIECQKRMGWKLLLDEHYDVIRKKEHDCDTISIIGVENISASRRFQTFGNLEKAMQKANGKFKILMSHDPSHWHSEVTNKTDIELTLSGHTHAMQFTVFGWSVSSFVYKEYNGLYKDGNQYLYVNIGLGETMFPFRIGATPEITVITLKHSSTHV